MRREYLLFFLFNAAGLVIELGVLALAKYGLGFTSLLALNVAKTGGVLLATAFRFWSYRTFVFQPAPVPAADPDVLAELDPVAELAEVVAELADDKPLEAGLADTIDADLEAELAAELHAASRRALGR
jgi:hypothetical protein